MESRILNPASIGMITAWATIKHGWNLYLYKLASITIYIGNHPKWSFEYGKLVFFYLVL